MYMFYAIIDWFYLYKNRTIKFILYFKNTFREHKYLSNLQPYIFSFKAQNSKNLKDTLADI
jgi:hypothetical protein